MDSPSGRQRRELARDYEAADRIVAKKLIAKWSNEQNPGKKSAGDLIQMLDVADIRSYQIRETGDYRAMSCSIRDQTRHLLDHLFVQYPVPRVLYDACIRQRDTAAGQSKGIYRLPGARCKRIDPFAKNRGLYRKWFVAVAQGASFPRLVKGLMTSRESALFLNAPDYLLVHECVWWAKMRAADIPAECIRNLITQLFGDRSIEDTDGRLTEAIRFFSRFHAEIDPRSIDNVLACIAWKLKNEAEFRLRGRTGASIVNLATEWRIDMQNARLAKHITWPGLGLCDWRTGSRDAEWRVTELRNNSDLYWEGRTQRNCVHTYVSDCTAGTSAIFSLRKFVREPGSGVDSETSGCDTTAPAEQSRATIEVENRAVVQVKSKANAPIDANQYAALKQWAAERALEIKV